jgi:hypothetical protein
VLEIFFPLFGIADSTLALFCPAFLRVLILSAAGSALSMLIYAWISPQRRLAAMKRLGSRVNKQLMAASDGEFGEVLALSKRSMILNLARLAGTLPGVAVGAVPLVALLLWTWRVYDRHWPPAGGPVEFVVTPADATVRASETMEPLGGGAYRVRLPAHDKTLKLTDAGGTALLAIPPGDGTFAWSRRTGAAWLLGSPDRPLRPDAAVERIEFRLPPRELLPAGPPWMRRWPLPFLIAAIVAPLSVKRWLGIV